jgi:hypothetical protein
VALCGLLGEGAPSASSIQRLNARFELEYEAWTKRDLSDLAVVYWWADGLYGKAGIADRKSALLTIVGALTTGEEIVLACESGERESKERWLMLLRNLKHRGPTFPHLTVADRRAPRDLGSLRRDPSDRGGAAVLEPHAHQCPQRSAEEGPAKGGRAAESDAVCGDERRL